MHLGVALVLAKVLGDRILVGVEIGDDHSLAEGGGQKGQQQKKGCALSEHAPVEVLAKIEQNDLLCSSNQPMQSKMEVALEKKAALERAAVDKERIYLNHKPLRKYAFVLSLLSFGV
jgi:hypothetical protein